MFSSKWIWVFLLLLFSHRCCCCYFFFRFGFLSIAKIAFLFRMIFTRCASWCVLKLCNGPHQASSQCTAHSVCVHFSFQFSVYRKSKYALDFHARWLCVLRSMLEHNSNTHRERQIMSNFIESILSHAHNGTKKEEIERKSEKRAIKSLRFRIS